MRKKILKPIGIGGASALIAITSLLSYAIGLFRDRIIAVNFGTTSATDTYNASFLIPDMLFNMFIAGALVAAFLPVFSDYLENNKKEAFKVANTMLTGASILIAVLAIIAFIFMENLVPVLFQNIDESMQQDIINMTRMMLPSAILFAISNTLGNILMSYNHFVAYAISPILYNIGIILGVILFNQSLGIYSAASGVLVGATFHCLIRIIDVYGTGYRYKPQLKISHPGFKKILKLMIPKSISLIAWQVNLYIFAFVGMNIIEGGLAAFNFARNIQSFAVSLFGIAFATAVFPSLTIAISKNNHEKFTTHIQKTIQRILFFTIPASIGIILMSKEIVALILSGGIFDNNSVKLTSLILFFFAISIPFESLVHILARSFYALKNTIVPMAINLFGMAIIAFSTIFIAPRYGIEWFSIGFSLGYISQVILLVVTLKKNFTKFDFQTFFSSIGKIIIATGIMTIAILSTQFLDNLIMTKLAYVIRITIGGGVFMLSAGILKSPEISSVKYILKKIVKKA